MNVIHSFSAMSISYFIQKDNKKEILFPLHFVEKRAFLFYVLPILV